LPPDLARRTLSAGTPGRPLLAAIVLRELSRWLRWATGHAGRPATLGELAEPIVPTELAAAEQAGRLSALRRGRPDLLS
jgi:hypothetical protein